GIDKSVLGRRCLIKRGLSAETAIFRTRARLGIHNRAKMNFVALETLANPVRQRHLFANVSAAFQIEQQDAFATGDRSALENAPGQLVEPRMIAVNLGTEHD